AQFLEITSVNFLALALEIRAEISSRFRTFVPFQPEPAQPVVNRARRFLGISGAVGVFDSQNKSAAGVLRVQPVEKGRPRTADMQVSRRRWSETNTDGRSHWSNGVV